MYFDVTFFLTIPQAQTRTSARPSKSLKSEKIKGCTKKDLAVSKSAEHIHFF
jgi:hypothetical protein